jgi:hypothetical protein
VPAPAKVEESDAPPANAGEPAAPVVPGAAEAIDPAAMEVDPNATEKVTAYDTRHTPPADAPVVGEFQWTSQRQFRERAPDCLFATELYEILGEWSITDLDADGVGEATFAWRAGCRSDVSPVTHKVLLVEHEGLEVKKFVLRGRSAISIAGTVDEGGEFEADPAFESAPKAFLEHARKVWKQTSVEKM